MKPYEILTDKTADGLENKIKTCLDMGKFELVSLPSFAGGLFVATVKNTQYTPPDPKDPTN